MQKDFKIGLAIGVILAAGVILWLATLPNLSAKARALQVASDLEKKNDQSLPGQGEGEPLSSNPSPQTPPIASSSAISQVPPDSEIRNTKYEIRDTNTEQPQRIHVVQKGDTLSSISAKYYGSARQWRKIVAANSDNLPNPNRLIPGSKLLIPQ
ncbi:MAG: LysM peptidoglycan-binding domain-containing protein [Sedimentisphaerales bacterium]